MRLGNKTTNSSLANSRSRDVKAIAGSLEIVDGGSRAEALTSLRRELSTAAADGVVLAFVELLSLARPAAFKRALRLRRYVLELTLELGLEGESSAPIEAAALLSQIGSLTLPEATATRYYHGATLSPADLDLVAQLPATAADILRHLESLRETREILLGQGEQFSSGRGRRPRHGSRIPIGARMLKIAHDFDLLEAQERSVEFALSTMRGRGGWYDPELLELFARLRGASEVKTQIKELRLRNLRPGMVFAEDVRSATEGVLLIARGQQASARLIERVNALPEGLVPEPVRMLVRETTDRALDGEEREPGSGCR